MSEYNQPSRSRPQMEGYGLPDQVSDAEKYTWDWASAQMAEARNYWVCTTRPDGRPHAMPVWGVWLDGTLYFSTGRQSLKGRNLAANPEVVVHLESGDTVVILEGVVKEEPGPALLARYADAYDAKYSFRPDPNDPANGVYALRVRLAFTWLESDFVESATRWRWEVRGEG